jgi:hypothetical protein
MAKNVPQEWFVSEKPVEVEIMGKKLKIRELTGDEYIGIVHDSRTAEGKLDAKKYANSLISKAVIEPKIIAENPQKLSGVKALLVQKIEEICGLSEEEVKKSVSQ